MSTTLDPTEVEQGIRSVTDEEVHFMQENGWVKLDGLLSKDLTAALLDEAKRLFGVTGDDIPVEEKGKRMSDPGMAAFYFNPHRESDIYREVGYSKSLGNSAKQLIYSVGNPFNAQAPVRLFSSSIICKVKSTGEASAETKWHQDGVMLPIDRAFGGGYWVALDEVRPEMGSLQYLTGSHKERPLGRIQVVEDPVPNWLFEKYETSPAFHLQPGDALAHDALTFHGASENTTDKNRWAFTTQRFAGDALYTGAKNSRTDGLDIPVNSTLDHELFPVVSD